LLASTEGTVEETQKIEEQLDSQIDVPSIDQLE